MQNSAADLLSESDLRKRYFTLLLSWLLDRKRKTRKMLNATGIQLAKSQNLSQDQQLELQERFHTSLVRGMPDRWNALSGLIAPYADPALNDLFSKCIKKYGASFQLKREYE